MSSLCYITLFASREYQRAVVGVFLAQLPGIHSKHQKYFWRRCRGRGSLAEEDREEYSPDNTPISGAVAREEKSRSIQVGLTNSSLAFTFVASCLSFSSPPLHICRFHSPFSFAVFSFAFFVRPFLSLAFCSLVCHVPSICLHLRLLISLRDPLMWNELLVS